MSTIRHPETQAPPPFVDGERMDQAEFRRRSEAMPEGKFAELIAGVVHMVFGAHFEHATSDSDLSGWLYNYRVATPGVRVATNLSTILGDHTEVQPDQQLLIPEALGGRSRLVGGKVVGPPELVVEVSDSTRLKDLGPKRSEYEKAGVPEYLFFGIEPAEVRWFALAEGRYEAVVPGADGLIRSRVFPGLWLDPKALIEGDAPGVIAALNRGLASPEHARFAAELAARRAP